MLTQTDMASMLLRGRVLQSKTTAAILLSEADGCESDEWGRLGCISDKVQGLEFSLEIADYTSDAAVASYNGVWELVSGKYGDITIDPNSQQGGTVVIIDNSTTVTTPDGRMVSYDDTKWDSNHLVYTEPLWAGFEPLIQINGQRFLYHGTEFNYLPTGGFTLTSPALDGDIYVVIF